MASSSSRKEYPETISGKVLSWYDSIAHDKAEVTAMVMMAETRHGVGIDMAELAGLLTTVGANISELVAAYAGEEDEREVETIRAAEGEPPLIEYEHSKYGGEEVMRRNVAWAMRYSQTLDIQMKAVKKILKGHGWLEEDARLRAEDIPEE